MLKQHFLYSQCKKKKKFPRREIQSEDKGGKTNQKQRLSQLNGKGTLGFMLHINVVAYKRLARSKFTIHSFLLL